MTNKTYKSLEHLYEAMRDGDETGDWSSLPTFGGEDIDDTREVWSWNATHMIVGTCACDIRIVPREDV